MTPAQLLILKAELALPAYAGLSDGVTTVARG
jgi:hypothetical protein